MFRHLLLEGESKKDDLEKALKSLRYFIRQENDFFTTKRRFQNLKEAKCVLREVSKGNANRKYFDLFHGNCFPIAHSYNPHHHNHDHHIHRVITFLW